MSDFPTFYGKNSVCWLSSFNIIRTKIDIFSIFFRVIFVYLMPFKFLKNWPLIMIFWYVVMVAQHYFELSILKQLCIGFFYMCTSNILIFHHLPSRKVSDINNKQAVRQSGYPCWFEFQFNCQKFQNVLVLGVVDCFIVKGEEGTFEPSFACAKNLPVK